MRRVGAFNVALQLKGGRKLTVAVLAGGVAFPALTVLLLKLQMMLHVIHKSKRNSTQVKQLLLKGNL